MAVKIHEEVGGYNINLFVGKRQDELDEIKCGICLEVFRDPKQCPNGHMHCNSCTQQFHQTSRCPDCRVTIHNWGDNLFVKNMISKMTVKCVSTLHESHMGSRSCEWQGQLSNLLHHVKEECQLTVMKCKFDGCEEQVMRADMIVHESDCLFRLVECKYCKAIVAFSAQSEHEFTCNWRPVDCDQDCGLTLPMNKLELHKTNDCPNTRMDCSMFQLVGFCNGCDGHVKRHELSLHLISEGRLAGNFTALLKHCAAQSVSFTQSQQSAQISQSTFETELNNVRERINDQLRVLEQKIGELTSNGKSTENQLTTAQQTIVTLTTSGPLTAHRLDVAEQKIVELTSQIAAHKEQLTKVHTENAESTNLMFRIAQLKHSQQLFLASSDPFWHYEAALCNALSKWHVVFQKSSHTHLIPFLNKKLDCAPFEHGAVVFHLAFDINVAEAYAASSQQYNTTVFKVAVYANLKLSVCLRRSYTDSNTNTKLRFSVVASCGTISRSRVTTAVLGSRKVLEEHDLFNDHEFCLSDLMYEAIDGQIYILCTFHVPQAWFERRARQAIPEYSSRRKRERSNDRW